MEERIKLMLGDNMKSLKELPDNSVDSIVTDPPYGLSFMNKKWDYDVPTVEFWSEVYRVLKPGGHVLSFGGTRTYHRMAVNIEDAGFEIRDQIMWIYGSGFPKSHNIGKAIQKLSGDVKVIGKKTGMGTTGNSYVSSNEEYIGGDKGVYKKEYDEIEINNEWEGWGTAIKPAVEPICVARKPLSEKSVAENVLKWGTGGLNIDASRIGIKEGDKMDIRRYNEYHDTFNSYEEGESAKGKDYEVNEPHEGGRFPANVILDEEASKILDQQSGISKGTKRGDKYNKEYDNTGNATPFTPKQTAYSDNNTYDNKGGASRFFYVPKVSKKERNAGLDDFEAKTNRQKGHGLDRICGNCGTSMLKPQDCKCETPDWITPPKKNTHPTVKPINLLTYLIRLVTPKNGVVMDCFMGSGSTGIAAQLEGFKFIGMEMDEDYFNIAEARINAYEEYRELLK